MADTNTTNDLLDTDTLFEGVQEPSVLPLMQVAFMMSEGSALQHYHASTLLPVATKNTWSDFHMNFTSCFVSTLVTKFAVRQCDKYGLFCATLFAVTQYVEQVQLPFCIPYCKLLSITGLFHVAASLNVMLNNTMGDVFKANTISMQTEDLLTLQCEDMRIKVPMVLPSLMDCYASKCVKQMLSENTYQQINHKNGLPISIDLLYNMMMEMLITRHPALFREFHLSTIGVVVIEDIINALPLEVKCTALYLNGPVNTLEMIPIRAKYSQVVKQLSDGFTPNCTVIYSNNALTKAALKDYLNRWIEVKPVNLKLCSVCGAIQYPSSKLLANMDCYYCD